MDEKLVSIAVSVPSSYLVAALYVCSENGYSFSELLDDFGLSFSELNSSGHRIPSPLYNEIITRLIDESEIHDLGLRSGLLSSLDDHGTLGCAAQYAPTLLSAIDLAVEFQDIIGPIVILSRVERNGQLIVTALPRNISGKALRYEIENSFISLTKMFSEAKSGFVAESVRFSCSEPINRSFYEESFGCEVLFSQGADYLVLSLGELRKELQGRDYKKYMIYRRQCELIRAKLMKSGDLPDKIRSILISSTHGFPPEERIAEYLGMSTRTLRRRLSSEGAVFRELLNEVRIGLAKEYLVSTSHTVSEVSQIVGYANVPAFHRAFKKYNSETPTQYRESKSRGS